MADDKDRTTKLGEDEIQQLVSAGRLAKAKLYRLLLGKIAANQELTTTELREFRRLDEEMGGAADPSPEEISSGTRILATMKDTATHYQKSDRTVRRWVKEGMPIEPGGRYDLDKIDAWLLRKRGGRKLAPIASDDSQGPAAEEDQDKHYWDKENKRLQAAERELKLQVRQGQLIEKAEMGREFVARIHAVKQGLLSLARSLPPDLIHCQNERQMADVIERAVKALLNSYARPLPEHLEGEQEKPAAEVNK